jgi:hypothetical protein
MNTSNAVRISERLELRPVPWVAVEAIVNGDRLPDWAEDFPDAGDRVIARMLHQSGSPEAGPQRPGSWGHYQVVERASGAVVGGAGFYGPPEGGVTEIGHGIIPSRQGSGYATEAVNTLLSIAGSIQIRTRSSRTSKSTTWRRSEFSRKRGSSWRQQRPRGAIALTGQPWLTDGRVIGFATLSPI